ncbi:MAG: ANTH domain-containing protein [Benjaminiella poitrasii]|nr:MAG: ANTH domain-containing protein [Benjaminiella poitrasii]
METAVRKSTRLDYNPPKQKYLQTLTNLTFQSPGNAASIVDLLEKRLRENSWIIIFKVLIIIHSLMRNGDGEKVISYVETRPSALDTSKLREKSSGVVHIQNIYLYTAYLEQKVIAYRNIRIDYVKNTMGSKEGRLRRLSTKDGLLKEMVILQKQIGTLLKCNFILDDVDNNISLYAFRLLIEDLLILFQVMNEAIVNILEHYFVMDKSDARTSLEIYKRFAKQTEDTIAFLNRARRLQHDMNISIPQVKHAPLSLAAALQEYLDDVKDKNIESKDSSNNGNQTNSTPIAKYSVQQQQQQQQPKELIDFFQSLENEKVNVFHNPATVQQPEVLSTGYNNPFRTMNNIVPQQSISSLLPNNNNNSNPFRASTMPQMSLSSPTTAFQYQNNQVAPFNNSTMIIQQAPSVASSNNTSNPFSPANTVALPSSLPAMIAVAPTTTGGMSNNPFNNATPKQQQFQTWTNSNIF